MTEAQAQAAKLARAWVWQSGHLAVATVRPDPSSDFSRTGTVRVDVADGRLTTLVGCWWRPITGATPVVDDPATADGLARTARAMWQDESLHIRAARGYSNELVFEVWSFRHQLPINIFDAGDGHPFFSTEKEALLAAILAAPEAQ